MTLTYLYLPPASKLPNLSNLKPFRAVIIVESDVTEQWQELVSTWLVKSGCFYMMAWGKESSTWYDSVKMANLVEVNFANISDEKLVMTTWHERETLKNVFNFSKYCAFHEQVDLENTILVHISHENREQELLIDYLDA